MPFTDHTSSLIELRGDRSSASLLASITVLGLLAYGLYYVGVLGWAIGLVSRLVRWAIRSGFRAWKSTFAWASWWVLLLVAVALLALGFLIVEAAPGVALALAGVAIFMGVSTCLAFMFIDIERYEVERGYKAVHNPLKGQELAPHLARYGHQVDMMLLIAATVATVGGFALLNEGLYKSGVADWYQVDEEGVGWVDFLAYSMLNLLRVVDVLDLARSKQLLDAAFVRPAQWPASVLIVLFRTFFTLVLLQQIFASIRQGRLLTETIADFWSPHEPIQQRAQNALPQYGVAAIGPLLVSLRSVVALTKEQRDQLPPIVAAIGPSTIPTLLRHLSDPHENVRAVCAAALGHLNAREALPALADLTRDPSDYVRQSLADALGTIAGAAARSDRVARVRGRLGPRRWFRGRQSLGPIFDPLPLVVAALRKLLSDEIPAVRGQAAVAAGRIGVRGDAALPDLILRLRDADETVRCQAAEALGRVGGKGGEAMSALVVTLEDPSPVVRAASANGLQALGTTAHAAVPHLVPLLQDRDDAVRAAASAAISAAGPLNAWATAELVEGLTSPDNVVRAQAAEAMGQVGAPAEETAVALAGVLRDSNDVVRAKAVEALGKIGEAAADVAVPSLVKALRDKDSWVSALAAEALGEMGEAADAAIPALIKALSHVNAQVRANAALALGKLGAEAERARAALERAATDDDGGVRAQSVRALGLLGTNKPRSLELILEALKDPDPLVREAAVEALSYAERPPGEIQGLLLPMLNDSNDQVKVQVTRVLARQAGTVQPVVDGLCRALTDDDSTWVQINAALALAGLGTAATAAGPALLRAARTGDASVREQAMKALAMVQPPEAMEAFTVGLKDPSAGVRLLASAGWVKAAAVPPEAVIGLVDALKDPEIQVRANAAYALSRLERLPTEAIPVLADNSTDPSDSLRLNAALALRNAPLAATAHVMETLLDDPNARVRLIAAGVLLVGDSTHAAASAVVETARSDTSPRVRQAAEELIQLLAHAAENPAVAAADAASPSEAIPLSA